MVLCRTITTFLSEIVVVMIFPGQNKLRSPNNMSSIKAMIVQPSHPVTESTSVRTYGARRQAKADIPRDASNVQVDTPSAAQALVQPGHVPISMYPSIPSSLPNEIGQMTWSIRLWLTTEIICISMSLLRLIQDIQCHNNWKIGARHWLTFCPNSGMHFAKCE